MIGVCIVIILLAGLLTYNLATDNHDNDYRIWRNTEYLNEKEKHNHDQTKPV